ncbi:JAB domain-containing protein [Pseudomonas sp. RGM 3321]|uniref:JAB domain-containing protein n=1 Tax=Pseudomonas sp. RGM 3321 TaxID=2930089 RepID=UPI0032648AD5
MDSSLEINAERNFSGHYLEHIDGASVYPRELVKEALRLNAAAVIVSHNHPSGNPEPSGADGALTQRLKEALGLVDVRVLDHIIVAGNATASFAERGLI